MTVRPTMLLEVNWSADGVTWVDETNYLIAQSWRRGRDFSSTQVGRIQTCTLKATLKNESGRYSPFNTSSPIYGQVAPTTKVRVRAKRYRDEVLQDSPAAYWRLGEPSGTNAADEVNGGPVGTYVASPTLGATGAVDDHDTAVTLNGSTQYVTVVDIAALRITGDITLEAWVQPTNFAALVDVVGKYGSANATAGPYSLKINSATGALRFARGTGAAEVAVVCDVALTAGVFSHAAVRMVGTTVTFFINGLQAGATKTISTTTTDAGQPFRIGASNAPSEFFVGTIDEVAVWSSGLSDARIYAHYVMGSRTYFPTTYTAAWTGFLDDIIPSPGTRDSIRTATLTASGPLRWIGDRESNTALYTSILAGAAIGHVLDDCGWPGGSRVIDVGQVLMTRWKGDVGDADIVRGDVKRALQHLQELEESEFGLVGEDKNGNIIFEDAHHRLLAPHTTSQATFSDNPGAALPYETIEQIDPWRMIFNRFVAQVETFVVASSAALWTMSDGIVPAIGIGASRDFFAVYPQKNDAANADHVDAWGAVVVTANSKSDGTGTDLTASIAVASTPTANTDKVTLTNNSGQLAFITALSIFGTAASRNDPGLVVSEDAASQTKYGKRTWPLGGKFYPSTDRAKNFTDWGLSRYKNAQQLLVIGFRADLSDTHAAQALGRDISDRLTVYANQTIESGAQLGMAADFFVEQEIHEYTLKEYRVTYLLSYAGDASVSGDGAYWILGLSTLDTTTRLVV